MQAQPSAALQRPTAGAMHHGTNTEKQLFLKYFIPVDLGNLSLAADRGEYSGRPLPVAGYRGKPCTVWIGRIAPTMEEGTMREILEHCGSIRSLRVYIDSTKGFCLATFSTPQGVYMAEHLVHGLVLDGQSLLVHLNRSTKQLLSALKAEKSKSNEPVVSKDIEAKARQEIESIVNQRKTIDGGIVEEANAAAMDFLTSLSTETQRPKTVEIIPPKKARKLAKGNPDQDNWREALRTLQRNERERLKRCELEADKRRDLAHERQRQIIADNEGLDPREGEPIHLRHAYVNSREYLERKKRKEKEIQDDLIEEQRLDGERRSTQAMKGNKVITHLSREQISKKSVNFDEDDAEVREKKLIPIQYSKEEMVSGRSRASKEALKKSIMSKIPKSMDDLEKYKVKWEYFDVAGKSVHDKILGWIGKKIKEMMGEEEPSFSDFIFQELLSHKPPHEFIENLKDVLDEDTENFVIKLFGVIIYETERIMNGG